MADPNNFRHRLHEALAALGWTQTELSAVTTLAPSTVSHLASGETVPMLVTALTISEVTGWTVDSLVGDQPLGEPDFERLPSPRHLVTTEWTASMRKLC